jgi:hypothetical protein
MRRPVPWLLASLVAVLTAAGLAAAVEVPSGRALIETAAGGTPRPLPVGAAASVSEPVVLPAPTTTVPPPPTTTTVTAAPAARRAPPHVVLWGDSLAVESAAFFAEAVQATGATAETRTMGGTAPCDWYAEILQRSAVAPVDVALLMFSGNSRTPCMRGPDGRFLAGAAKVEKYRADVGGLADHLRGLGGAVYLIGPPVMRPDFEPNRVEALLGLYRDLAGERDGVFFADAGSAVLAEGGYAERLPCLPSEGDDHGCVGGTIAVRSPDGVHFCPTATKGSCPVYSSGAVRFAAAMAATATIATQAF